MRLSWNRGLSTLILLVTLGLVCCTAPEAAQQRINLFLRAGGTFDPSTSEPHVAADLAQRGVLAVKTNTARSANAANASLGHYIVQFDGPVVEEWKAPVTALGGRIFHYLPDYAFVVRIAARQLPRLRRVAHVRSVRPFHPGYALSPLLPRPSGRSVRVNIKTFSPEDLPGASLSVRRLGGKIFATSTSGGGMLTADLPASAARVMARIFGVAWVEPAPYFVRHSAQANGNTGVEKVRQEANLYGTNQVIAVADTGLDTGDNGAVGIGVNSTNMHVDFRGRILQAQDFNTRGVSGETRWDDPNGHGTHVLGVIAGSGKLDGADPTNQQYNGRLSGAAPEANFVVQSILDSDGGMLGAAQVQDLYFLFQAAYDAGARIHNNSWGAFSGRQPFAGQTSALYYGEYLTQSQSVDRFTWDHPDMVVVFSAGNGAQDSDENGFVDGGTTPTIEVPATAKNCIAVGATENHRPNVPTTYPQLMPLALLGGPLLEDRVADFRDGMAAFSARGYCNDPDGAARERRVKPDVVAPGTYVLAARTTRSFVPFENFESTAAGSLPSGWGNRGGIATVTDKDGYPGGGHSAGFGNPSDSYPEPVGENATHNLVLPAIPDAPLADSLFVSYRARWNLRGSDAVRCQYGNNYFGLPFVGSSNGWEYRLDRIPISGARSGDLQFTLSTISRGQGSYYFLIDDLRVTPGLHDTTGRLESEKAETDVDRAYQYASGTSVAAAQVSGSAALVRQYYQEALNHPSPSAALIKATLMAGAADLYYTPGQGQYPSHPEQPAPRPNYVEGWGRADLQKSLLPGTTAFTSTRLLSADVSPGLGTGETDTYELEIREGTPLNVALVWTDPPAAEASGVTLVNNLDLELRTTESRVAWGNRIVNGSSIGDERNNVETIDFPSGLTSGVYTLRVTGRNVPQGRQPYALVVYGDAVYSSRSTLKISPSEAFCQHGRSYAFQALFNGQPTTGVTWTVLGPGSIDSDGVYTAPNSGLGTSTVEARYTLPRTSTTFSATSLVTILPETGGGPTLGHVSVSYAGVPGELSVVQFGYGGPASPGPPTEPAAYYSDNKRGDPGTSTVGGTLTRDFDLSGAGAGRFPPSAGNIWWVKVKNDGGTDAEIRDLYILHDGKRYSASGPAVTVPANSTAYRYIDASNVESVPEVYAYAEIYHDKPSDLTRVYVGSPKNGERDEWVSALHTGSGSSPGVSRFFIDLTGAPAGSLPPDAGNSWFLHAEDGVPNGAQGSIRKFYIYYNGARFDGRVLPLAIPESGFARAWIDYTPPTVTITSPLSNSTVGGLLTIDAIASDNAWITHVAFYVDDRLVGIDNSSPYQFTSDTQFDTNIWHRVTARAFDAAGNSGEESIQVRTENGGVRPNVVGTLGGYTFNPVTRELRATMTFRNDSPTGTRAYRATLQRVTLWCTGPSFKGERRLYMQPATPPALPLKIPGAIPGEIEAGGFSSLPLRVIVPPEITAIARWTGTGYYYDAPTGGTRFNM